MDESWRAFFEGIEFCHKTLQAEKEETVDYPNEFKVINLINGYRSRGHLFTKSNPVRTRRKYSPNLDPENFGLGRGDRDKEFSAGTEIGLGKAKLSEIIDHLRQTYCQSVGVEYFHIRNTAMVEWLRSRMESKKNTPSFSTKKKHVILAKLAEGVLLEKFIHKRFLGHKSFSLEGAESLIPALESLIQKGSELGIREFVIGMAHRGRLNVLANIMHKPLEQIFSEFEGKEYRDGELLGDVNYHLGYSSEVATHGGEKAYLTLVPNPSHLEAVGPVAEGLARALIDQEYDDDNSKIAPILIHGDASISGQGIVYELIQMADLEGYRTGGTIHLVINNQIGFTTNYLDGRSSTYCTDVAKTIESPIFHVNSDDVEAVVYTVLLAMEFRQAFHRDVFVDLLGYRKYGHNEGDEPRYTQPILYKAIEKHSDPLEIYLKKFEAEGSLDQFKVGDLKERITGTLEAAYARSKNIEKGDIPPFLTRLWTGITRAALEDFEHSPATGVEQNRLIEIGNKLTGLPPGPAFFHKIIKLQEERRKMLQAGGKLDWAMAELLAYGSLVSEGFPVRISGQDCQRGTFSHRHAVLTIEDSEDKFIPLQHIEDDQAAFRIYNSLLSEYAVLGFEYGYSLGTPDGLTIWEAQFGDFCNGGQVIFDQYISSAEDKWKVSNGLTVFLPHGYEGQGPEHSSARIERFLSLCGHENMQIVNCTTPANMFHALRRQSYRPFRKPLIIFTPKSLLRYPRCTSSLEDFASGAFREILDDSSCDPDRVTKVVICSGKVFYDILQKRDELKKEDVALVRLEQLYPLPLKQLKNVLARYRKAQRVEWAQEEPANMGPLKFIFQNIADIQMTYVARPPSGSPATGSSQLHKIQQKLIAEKALGMCSCKHAFGSCRLKCADTEEDTLK